MKRRDFIKKGAALAAGGIVMPYILPSGRLFARTQAALADHVIYVLFAGGVRQQESILQRYIADSQNAGVEGNIMYNILEGEAPDRKIVYGTTPAGETPGSRPIPRILSTTLQKQGTLFSELRAVNGGHYGGLTSLVTGNRATSQGLKVRPQNPTIFEYLRRHAGFRATDTWFIGNGIGNSVPLLNSSDHPSYGVDYGANFFAPLITFGGDGQQVLSNAKVYHPQEELDPIYRMKNFLDNTFRVKNGEIPGIRNTEEEKIAIRDFVRNVFQRKASGQIAYPPVSDNGDMQTIAYATEILREFKPRLLVVNMSNVDGCHSSFTGYLKALHRADQAVGFLWNFIQNQVPEMAGKTILMATPECGRNLNPNPIQDENDWFAYDHSGDLNTSRIFSIMAGPNVPSDLVVGSENNPVGLATDMVPTIAEIFGVKNDVMNAGFIDGQARSLFDRI